ncbi:hypothetical protein F443_19704 [Phytophthora nicotianae P1569]|uniref:Uncharacterized protein n=1 Tax=Phytophthora nicotianae P1569 TaxID=1317065 RepID=V9E526_PHYNI|nr:hypothetical protein F443_19704 [Phytophthora nicotianae P1569]
MTKTRSTTTNLPEDDSCRATMPIFAPELPPRLSSTLHASLVK